MSGESKPKGIVGCTALLAIIERIEGLVDWHADVEADVSDPSPEDSHAHCNGLVLQECKKARDILANDQAQRLPPGEAVARKETSQ